MGTALGPLGPESIVPWVHIQIWFSGHSAGIKNSLWLFVEHRVGQVKKAASRICWFSHHISTSKPWCYSVIDVVFFNTSTISLPE